MQTAHIGASITIKGELVAQEDVTIAGRLEGSILVKGHRVIIEQGASVLADIEAREVIVSGEVLGSIAADERLTLKASAVVEGELSSPAIAITEGAQFQGKVETKGERKRVLQLAS